MTNQLAKAVFGATVLVATGLISGLVWADCDDAGHQLGDRSGGSQSKSIEPTLGSPQVVLEDQAPSSQTEFGSLFPSTDAERELNQMLHERDENIDLALANWLIATDIPEFRDLTREAYFTELDAMTERVHQDMQRMQRVGWHGANPNDPDTRCCRFCSAIIRLRLTYTEEFRQEDLTPAQTKALYSDANNIFLAGLLRGRHGSCVSMPLVYLVIGQRLGLPVHLVTVGKHYFIRWEERGYRMNIEPTITEKIAMTPDDSVYLEIEGMTSSQLTGNQMRDLTNREVVGNLLYTRSAYWATKGTEYTVRQCADLAWARRLAPDDPAIETTQRAVFHSYGLNPECSLTDITQRIGRIRHE